MTFSGYRILKELSGILNKAWDSDSDDLVEFEFYAKAVKERFKKFRKFEDVNFTVSVSQTRNGYYVSHLDELDWNEFYVNAIMSGTDKKGKRWQYILWFPKLPEGVGVGKVINGTRSSDVKSWRDYYQRLVRTETFRHSPLPKLLKSKTQTV